MWINSDNFDLLLNKVDKNQTTFSSVSKMDTEEFKVAYDELDKDQKKLLPVLEGDFKVYTTEKSRPPKSLKDKIIKERLKPKSPDIIKLIQLILKEKDRDKVYNTLILSKISPIVFQIWLLRVFQQNPKTTDLLSKLELYSYYPETYFSILSNYTPRKDIKFKFPKKLRE